MSTEDTADNAFVDAANTSDVPTASVEGEETQADSGEGSSVPTDSNIPSVQVEEVEEKESFASKCSYILVLIGYAVGFGNIWRFPYLMQSNGGVVFLIPYCISLAFLGIPTFFLELAIGQRLRKGSLHAWNEISPYLGGVGIAAGGSCFIVGFYYNTLIAWCLFYFGSAFMDPLPWEDCKILVDEGCLKSQKNTENQSAKCEECLRSGASSYFWYNRALGSTRDIEHRGDFSWKIFICLFVAWFVTWAILVKGIKTTGKVAYFTALFPYVVLVIFLGLGLDQPGMKIGYEVVFQPNFTKLLEAEVWFRAGTQIFFSLGLGFGILVSFSALLPANNNCYRDALAVASINCLTSLFAAMVVFPTLGAKGTREFNDCRAGIEANLTAFKNVGSNLTITDRLIIETNRTNQNKTLCNLEELVTKSAQGTGLIFIAYAEVISKLRYPQVWAVLFFSMVLTLGIDSGFTTVEGAVMCLHDWNLFNMNIKKWKLTTGICLFLWIFSIIFCFGWAEYMLTFIDDFTTNWVLLVVGFFECIGVAWVYGLKQFSYDIQLMTGHKPNLYMMICWRFISPFMTFCLFVSTCASYFTSKTALQYGGYESGSAEKKDTPWPTYLVWVGFLILVLALGAVPLIAILAYFKIYVIKETTVADFPEEDLRKERHIVDEDFSGPESTLQKVLYWGSSTDLRRGSSVGTWSESGGDSVIVENVDSSTSPAPTQADPDEYKVYNSLVT